MASSATVSTSADSCRSFRSCACRGASTFHHFAATIRRIYWRYIRPWGSPMMRSTFALRSAALGAVALAILLAGCGKPENKLPPVQGKAPVAAQAAKSETPQVFALASAHPEQFQGQLAIA